VSKHPGAPGKKFPGGGRKKTVHKVKYAGAKTDNVPWGQGGTGSIPTAQEVGNKVRSGPKNPAPPTLTKGDWG